MSLNTLDDYTLEILNDYTYGHCHICKEGTKVRCKNIYHMGSEGLEICWNCEEALLDYIGIQKRMFMRIKRDNAKNINEHPKYLEDFLCIIHRDGGQYITKHGVKKAIEEAKNKYYSLIKHQDKIRKLLNRIYRCERHAWEKEVKDLLNKQKLEQGNEREQ